MRFFKKDKTPSQDSNSPTNRLPAEMIDLIAHFLTNAKDLVALSTVNCFFLTSLKTRVEQEKRLHSIQIKATTTGCFLCLGGNLYACGANDEEQLGIANKQDQTTLKRVTLSVVIQFAATDLKLIYLKKNNVFCIFGQRQQDEPGIKELNLLLSNKILSEQTVQQIYLNKTRGIFLTHEGKLYTWGKNLYGELGVKDNNDRNHFTLCWFSSDSKPIDVIMSFGSTYCLTEKGTVYAWGQNKHGELGLGDKRNRNYPHQVPLPLNCRSVQLEVQGESVYSVMDDGSVYAWGQNNNGQLGMGFNTEAVEIETPTQIKLPDNKKCHQLFGNLLGVLCLMEDGSIYAWGSNGHGQLGVADTTSSLIPQRVSLENKKVAQIVTENGSVFAIAQDGELYSWGYNLYGQLGLGDNKSHSVPQRVSLPNNARVLKLVVNPLGKSVYCLTTQGLLYSWGYNADGQLGLGHTENQNTPQQVPFSELAKWLRGESLSCEGSFQPDGSRLKHVPNF